MKKRRSSTFERLQKKILDELGIHAEQFRRTHAGCWQRRAGAFVWQAVKENGKIIGSIEPASILVKAKHLAIVPEEGEIFGSE